MTTRTAIGLTVRSVAFEQGGSIPKRYSCEGENTNPPLEIEGFPPETRTLAIIVEDPDALSGVFVHWLAWNIPSNEPIAESSGSGRSGLNGFGKIGYSGPCPPSGSHRYFFKVYALDDDLDLPEGSNKKALLDAMKGHILASGGLMAHYKKSS